MSEHWPEFDSEQPKVESEAVGSSSANGASPESAVGVADELAEDPAITHDAPADELPTTAELTDEASVSEAAEDVAASPAEPAVADEGVTAVAADEGPATAAADDGAVFLAELVRAMQATASQERLRIAEDTERRRQAHIALVRARETSEADRMRDLAGEDMKAIEAWADGETRRIELERERRAKELNDDLALSLAEHRSKIDREIESVETAIATYRAEVDAFFEGLGRETDLILIAQHAAVRPVFPTLEAVAETVATSSADASAEPSSSEAPPSAGPDDDATGAGTAGETEPAVVGVMDPQAAADAAESWAAPAESSPEPASAEASDDVDQDGEARESAEPVTAGTAPNHGNVGSLFKSVPVLRPMSWLRDAIGGDISNREG